MIGVVSQHCGGIFRESIRLDATCRRTGNSINARACSFSSRLRAAISFIWPFPLRHPHWSHNTFDRRRRLQLGLSAISSRIRTISADSSCRPCTTRVSLVISSIVAKTETGVQHKMQKKEDAHVRYQCRRGIPSMPCSSNCSSSGRRLRLAPSPDGHPKVPRSRRFVHNHSPEPSQYKSRILFLRLLVKTNRCPLRTSWLSTVCVSACKPLKPSLMSMGLRAINVRVAGEMLSTTHP